MSSLSLRSSTRTVASAVRGRFPAPSEWDARRIFLANLVVLGVAACFAVLYRFAGALFILFVGIALGMAVKPGVEGLRRHGLSRWAGALTIYAALGAVFAGVLLLAVPVIAEQLGTLIASGPRQVIELRDQLLSSQSHTLQRIGSYLPARIGQDAGPGLDAATLAGYGGVIGRNVFTVTAVLLLGFYWTLEGERRTRALALFAPLERRRAVHGFITEVEQTVGAYLRGQSLVCLIIGVLAFIIYRLIGLPHASMLGIVYALGEAIPVLGPIIGTCVAALAAMSVAPSLVVWVIAAAVFLQLLENYVLIPRVMVRVVGVNPLVTLLAITAFGSVLGISGAIMAIPMAAIVQLLLYRFFLDAEAQRRENLGGRDSLNVVRYEVQELGRHMRRRARGRERRTARVEPVEDALEGIAVDLDRILGERERGA